jgi:hypothetical protein
LLGLSGRLGAGRGFAFVRYCARIQENSRVVHKAARAGAPTGGDRGKLQRVRSARSTASSRVSGFSVSSGSGVTEFAVCQDASFCGASGSVVGTSMLVGKWHSSDLKGCTRTSGRQTAHVGLSNFRLTHGGKVFRGSTPMWLWWKGENEGRARTGGVVAGQDALAGFR